MKMNPLILFVCIVALGFIGIAYGISLGDRAKSADTKRCEAANGKLLTLRDNSTVCLTKGAIIHYK